MGNDPYGQQGGWSQQPGGGSAAGYGAPINNWLIPAILSTLLCCLPAGVVGIVFAAQVNGKQQAGDHAGAQRAAKNAKTWTIVSVVLGIVVIILAFSLGLFGALTGSSDGNL